MDVTTSIEQVAGILHRAGLRFDPTPGDTGYRLLFEPDEAVVLAVEPWRRDSVLITLSSPVLQDVPAEGAGAAVVQNRLHELDHAHRFAKFLWTGDTLLAVHDLLGDTLQAGELLNAVHALAAAASEVAAELQPEVGGLRYRGVLEQAGTGIEFDEAWDE
jgi:hypothetical protein